MGRSGLFTKQVGRVGFLYVNTDEAVAYAPPVHPINVTFTIWNKAGGTCHIDLDFTREEALELGRALVASYSIHLQED